MIIKYTPYNIVLCPWLRPLVRGKVKELVLFGTKLDLSLDREGYQSIEKISFEACNESACLIEAVERMGRYPECVLVEQIYRTRGNRNYCKGHGIRLSDPKPSRRGVKAKTKKYQNNTNRIEVERAFSLSKRSYGMECIITKLE